MDIEIILKILLGAVLGGIVGLERELSYKNAGLKSCVLISIGTTLITALSLKIVGNTAGVLSLPLMAHLISAVGIISAGIIIRERLSIHGVTTAFSIWCAGGLGITVGMGYYLTAFGGAIFIVAAVITLKSIARILEKQGKIYIYVISTDDRASVLIDIKKILTDLNIRLITANIAKIAKGYEIEMVVHTSPAKNKILVQEILQIADVKEITGDNF